MTSEPTPVLPQLVRDVLERFLTTEYTTVTDGQPVTWPVTPYWVPEACRIDVSTGLGAPKKAHDARRNPKVALLFSDPTGSGVHQPPQVLVQGIASVDDHDVAANFERATRQSAGKLPGRRQKLPPPAIRRMLAWYFARIFVSVHARRIHVWPGGDVNRGPQLLDPSTGQLIESHYQVPVAMLRPSGFHAPVWDERVDRLDQVYPTAVLSVVAPDGFPFAVRVPIRVDAKARWIRIAANPVGVPVRPGPACLTAHAHDPRPTSNRRIRIHGDLVTTNGGWALVPQELHGGLELLSGSPLFRSRVQAARAFRFRRRAKRELRRSQRPLT